MAVPRSLNESREEATEDNSLDSPVECREYQGKSAPTREPGITDAPCIDFGTLGQKIDACHQLKHAETGQVKSHLIQPRPRQETP